MKSLREGRNLFSLVLCSPASAAEWLSALMRGAYRFWIFGSARPGGASLLIAACAFRRERTMGEGNLTLDRQFAYVALI